MCKLSMLLMLRSTLITYAGTIWWIVCMTHYIMLIICKTTKTSWKSLHKKYKTENVGIKKFVVSQFLDYMIGGFQKCNQSSARKSSNFACYLIQRNDT